MWRDILIFQKNSLFHSKKQAKIQKYSSKLSKKMSRDTLAQPLPCGIWWHSSESVTYYSNCRYVKITLSKVQFTILAKSELINQCLLFYKYYVLLLLLIMLTFFFTSSTLDNSNYCWSLLIRCSDVINVVLHPEKPIEF